jgi:hypothetical protein
MGIGKSRIRGELHGESQGISELLSVIPVGFVLGEFMSFD